MPIPSQVIPECFRDQIATMPEYSYGVNRVTVTLSDETRFNDVFVAWGEEIVKVGTLETIPFDSTKIVKVERQ